MKYIEYLIKLTIKFAVIIVVSPVVIPLSIIGWAINDEVLNGLHLDMVNKIIRG